MVKVPRSDSDADKCRVINEWLVVVLCFCCCSVVNRFLECHWFQQYCPSTADRRLVEKETEEAFSSSSYLVNSVVKIVRRQENILLPIFIATIIDNSGRLHRWDAMLGVDRSAFSVEFAAVVATVSSRFVLLSSVPSLTLKPGSCLVDLEMKTMSRDGG